MSTSSGLIPAARKLSGSFCFTSKSAQLLRQLVANPRLDDYGLLPVRTTTVLLPDDLIQAVGRRLLLPHRFRHHAEHGAAILQMGPICQDG